MKEYEKRGVREEEMDMKEKCANIEEY
jgi:hypothetical protein